MDEDNKDIGKFLDELRKLAVIGLPILFILGLVALIKSRNQQPRRNRISIPIEED